MITICYILVTGMDFQVGLGVFRQVRFYQNLSDTPQGMEDVLSFMAVQHCQSVWYESALSDGRSWFILGAGEIWEPQSSKRLPDFAGPSRSLGRSLHGGRSVMAN